MAELVKQNLKNVKLYKLHIQYKTSRAGSSSVDTGLISSSHLYYTTKKLVIDA